MCCRRRRKRLARSTPLPLRGGKFYGDNTDYDGFGKMLSINQIETEGKTAAVLGTGGAAKAVVAYLLDHGVKGCALSAARRTKSPGLNSRASNGWSMRPALPQGGTFLSTARQWGCTPIRAFLPVDRTVVERFEALVDLIYNPRQTEFLRLGRLCGQDRV